LLRETAIGVADQRSSFVFAAGKESGAKTIPIGNRQLLDAWIEIALDALDLRGGDSAMLDGLILEEALRAFGNARVSETSEFTIWSPDRARAR
jgi:hypothetical protein